MIAKRPRARFCHTACRDAYREDAACGAIYLSIRTEDGKGYWTPEQWSLVSGTCCYCWGQVTRRPRIKIPPRPRSA